MKTAGSVAIVTGGAQGMGRAFCEVLLQHGAKVLLSDVLATEGEKTTKELQQQFGDANVAFAECNVTNQQQIKNVFAKCAGVFGCAPDIVTNVAGIANEFNWRKCVEVNIGGTLEVCEQALEVMSTEKGGKGGVIILMASISGLRPDAWGPVYNATKHAVVGYTRSMGLKKNMDVTGVRFNCICPTTVDTPFLTTCLTGERKLRFAEETAEGISKMTAEQKLSPSYVAEGLIELIEDDSLSGQALRVTKAKGRDLVVFEDHPLQ